MSTIKCDIYRISFSKKNLKPVLTQLELANSFEPLDPIFQYKDSGLEELKKSYNSKYQNIKDIISFLSNFKDSKKKASKISSNINIDESKLDDLITKIKDLKSGYDQISKNISDLNSSLANFEDIKNQEVKLNPQSELFKTKLLKMDVNIFDDIKYDLIDNELINFEAITQVEKTNYVLVIFDPATETLIEEIIKNKKLEELKIINKNSISIKDYYLKIKSEIDDLSEKRLKLEEKIKKMSENNLDSLKKYSDILKLNIKSLDQAEFVGYSFGKDYNHLAENEDKRTLQEAINDNTLIKSHIKNSDILHIDGWVLPDSADELESKLKKINKNIDVVKLDRDKLSQSRSSMKNPRVFQPFETVTSLMGTPNTNEIDPSPYVAPFFVAFFGFALGDAGYGIVITLVSLYALLKMKLGQEAQKGVALMLYCGISTIIFGALTGGWFGADLAAIGPVGEFLAQFKVFDIASNIIMVLVGSLVIGFIHQIFGLLLSMYSHIKNGNILLALEKPGTWILFLFAIIGYAFNYVNLYALLGVILLFAWGQGTGTKNPVLRLLKGATGLFGITSYLSNTLSYARLLALALATGVIASVVNLLATLFSGDIPVVSQLIAVVILVIGHAFNLILNLVGTFINVVRLHLVEFFPHFFDAQGVPIQPLKFESDYIIIEDDTPLLDFVLSSE